MESHVLLVLTDADVSTLSGLHESTITIQDVSQEGSEKNLGKETRVVTIITQADNGENETETTTVEEGLYVPSDAILSSRSVGIQVEAEEEKLRRSAGLPPSRRLCLPQRFGDYIVGDKNNDSDSDYCPQEESRSPKVRKKRVGRPKKQPADGNPDCAPTTKLQKVKDRPFSCEVCQKRFSQKGNMKIHMRIHSADKPFSCKTCGKSFKGKDPLHRHMMMHTGEKPFACNECDSRLSSAVALKEHQAIHSGEMLYQCSTCLRGFRFASILQRHMIRHTGEKRFSCLECGRRFSHKEYLRSHRRMHTGERPYECAKCSKKFAHLSDLKRHGITHTGLKPYTCKLCKASFNDASSHRRHERAHTRTKLYICELCQEAFKRPGLLKQHVLQCNGLQKSIDLALAQPSVETAGGEEAKTAVQGILRTVGSNPQTDCVTKSPITVILDESSQENTLPHCEQEDTNSTSTPINETPSGSTSQKSPSENSSTCASLANKPPSCDPSSPQAMSHDSGSLICNTNPIFAESTNNSEATNADDSQNETVVSQPGAALLESLLSSTAIINYVNNPDFGCQDYYNWLSSFTTVVKLLPVPLQSDVFTKISQVHKTLTDILASPSGVLATKENFQIVLSISKELHSVIAAHLSHIFNTLES